MAMIQPIEPTMDVVVVVVVVVVVWLSATRTTVVFCCWVVVARVWMTIVSQMIERLFVVLLKSSTW